MFNIVVFRYFLCTSYLMQVYIQIFKFNIKLMILISLEPISQTIKNRLLFKKTKNEFQTFIQ